MMELLPNLIDLALDLVEMIAAIVKKEDVDLTDELNELVLRLKDSMSELPVVQAQLQAELDKAVPPRPAAGDKA